MLLNILNLFIRETMQRLEIEAYLSQLTGSMATHPFDQDTLVYKVMHKMFALVYEKAEERYSLRLSLKCDPADAEVLVSQFEEIEPGYHLNKRHWITVSISDDLSTAFLCDLMQKSYELVVANLLKRDREALAKLQ